MTSPRPGSPSPHAAFRIALVAGEASGDQLGADLIRELQQRYPNAEFSGIGGPQMHAAGLNTWHDCSELAVMGLFEVLKHLPRLLRLRKNLYRRLLDWQPDIFIGIDAPDFNLGLERQLKQAGICTVHYVSPSVWAWRGGRAAKIGRSVDLVLCLFPMEPPIYARYGVNACFVGHPLADKFPLHPDAALARSVLALPESSPILAVLPGSRLGEIRRLLPMFLEAAKRVSIEIPELRIVMPAANASCYAAIERELARTDITNIVLLDGHAHEVMIAADVVLLASGTAALEAMLAKRPMVVGYRINTLTYWLVMALGLIKVNRYSLPNVLANEPIVPEFMQGDCTPENLANAILQWFHHPETRAMLEPRYLAIHERLRGNDSVTAADAIGALLPKSSQ